MVWLKQLVVLVKTLHVKTGERVIAAKLSENQNSTVLQLITLRDRERAQGIPSYSTARALPVELRVRPYFEAKCVAVTVYWIFHPNRPPVNSTRQVIAPYHIVVKVEIL